MTIISIKSFCNLMLIIGILVSAARGVAAPDKSSDTALEIVRNLSASVKSIQEAPNELNYKNYFLAYPRSFEEVCDIFAGEEYADILYEDKNYESWEYGLKYQVEMCKAYEYTDHKVYLEKIVELGIQANSWGGAANADLHIGGDIFKRLLWGVDCYPQTLENYEERNSLILNILIDKSLEEAERFYQALSWYDGNKKIPATGFLTNLCEMDSTKCKLLEKYGNKP